MIGISVVLLLSVSTAVAGLSPQFGVRTYPSSSSLYSTTGSEEETPKLALLTFDLDDTLFPVMSVVFDADVAMIQAFHAAGYPKATDTNILRHTKAIQRKSKRRMTYTELRKRAIQQELEFFSMPGDVVNYDLVHDIYNAWLDERHRSAERNLFVGAIDMLNKIKEKYPHVCIAAITNGRGNPLFMNSTLAPYFEFCISGEDDKIFPERKPQKGIFKACIAAYHERYPRSLTVNSHVWCHVGDCLANDVWGSSRNGAHAVWIELEELKKSTDSQVSAGGQPSWSTLSPRHANSRRKLGSKGMKDVSEKISRLNELPNAIEKILEKQNIKNAFLRSRGLDNKG